MAIALEESSTFIIAADTGGTFTDLAALDRSTGRLIYTKSLTTYRDLVDGVMECLRKTGIDLSHAELVKFGTTLVINTFVQRNGSKTALVTTEGHRDVLEIRRGNRAEPFDLRYARDPALVERDLRFEVSERIGSDGAVVRPLDTAGLEAIARKIASLGVESLAVSFLNAYVNDRHEQRAAEILRRLLPGVYVAVGTELSREWFEYERTSTAVANAYVGPRLCDYIGRLDARLRGNGFAKTFYMMASNGGVFSLARAQRQPVALLESGPVGGAIGAGAYAQALELAKVIAFDMGGTTAKCAVVENGVFDVRSPYYVGGESKGFPVRHSVLDIIEVGAGGGSIAWLDAHGALRVGPKSAGSDPGPACYGRGGTEPTITDANLVLGRIGASSFLGGEMRLDERGAESAVGRLATSLGFEGAAGRDEMAQGILALGSMTMAHAIKQITVERGLDPRDFALIAFGGGGPLHGASLAREMNIPELIVPPEPGIFSALGMILADARVDETRTFLRALAEETVSEMGAQFEAMEHAIRTSLAHELSAPNIIFDRQAEMRFLGQRHVVKVSVGRASSVADVRQAFETAYRRRYGFVDPDAPAELVSLVVTALARLQHIDLTQFRPDASGAQAARGTRQVYFADRKQRLDTPVYQRHSLPEGFSSRGPAIIEEYGSTTVVGPDDHFRVGALGELRVRFD